MSLKFPISLVGKTLSNLVSFGNSSRSFEKLHEEAIIIPDTDLLSFGDGTNDSPFSLSCWVKIDWMYRFRIFSKWDYVNAGDSNIEYLLSTDGSGYLFFLLADNSHGISGYQGIKSSFNLSSRIGVWTHLVATYDGRGGATANQGCELYIDGNPMSYNNEWSSSSYVAMENTTSDPAIGITNESAVNRYFSDGKMSDCRVYDRVLSSQEVADIYQKVNVQSGLIGHWLTDIDSVQDQSSNNLGGSDIVSLRTSTSAPPLPSNPVFGNRYLLCDGSDFFTIEQNSAMESIFQSSHTFAFWVKFLDGNPFSTQMIFGAQSASGASVTRVACFIGADGKMTLGYLENGNQGRAKTTTAQANGLTDWVHVVGVTTPTGMSIYLDGVQETLDATDNGDMSGVTMTNYSNNTDLYVGARSLVNEPDSELEGRLCDFRIYSKALSQSEISDLVAGTDVQSGLEHHYLTNDDDRLDKAGTSDGYDSSVYRPNDAP
jgi:hypothetical protein